MRFTGTDRCIFFDCDETLVLTNMPNSPLAIPIEYQGHTYRYVPHEQHVEEIHRYKADGATIVVWSAQGSSWAETVVRALGLQSVVDVCLSKPEKYFDDLNVTQFMPNTIREYVRPILRIKS